MNVRTFIRYATYLSWKLGLPSALETIMASGDLHICSEAECRADGVYNSSSLCLQIKFSKFTWKTCIPLKKVKGQERKKFT